jgi:hypothetical protein
MTALISGLYGDMAIEVTTDGLIIIKHMDDKGITWRYSIYADGTIDRF